MDGDACVLLQIHVTNLTIIIGENGSWYCLKMPPIIYVNSECWWCQFNSSSIWLAAWRCLLLKCMHIEKQSYEIIILLRRCVKSFFFPPLPTPQACKEGRQRVYWIYVNGFCLLLDVYISFFLLLQNLSYFSEGSLVSKNWCDINWWCSYAPRNSSLLANPTLIKLLVGQLLICYRKGKH